MYDPNDNNDNSHGQPMGLEDVISKLMSNPSLTAAVSQAVSAMKSSPSLTGINNDTNTVKEEENTKKSNTSDAENAMASDRQKPFNLPPEMLASLSSMLGGAASSNEKRSPLTQDENSKKRCALLAALKPYLNSHRCETIDYMLSIDRLSNALKTVKKQ